MTLQFIRQARLLVGSPGNPGKIGVPGTPPGTRMMAVAGKNYPVDANGSVTIPDAAYETLPQDFKIIPEIGYNGVTRNNDGTTTLTGVNGAAVKETPGTPNVAATPSQGLDLSQLRFRFTVTSRSVQTPKTLDCTVFNLSRETANVIFTEFTRVQLSAGYAGNLGVIFDGTLTSPARLGRASQVDTTLDFYAAEADQAHNFAVVNTTLAAGNTPDDHFNALLKALAPYGITRGYVPSPLPGTTLPRGCTMFGMVRDHLRNLARATDCDWNIEGDQLNFVLKEGYAPGDVIEINSRTGMIGLPEQTSAGINVRCLLNPAIKTGRIIHINNASIQKARVGTDLNAQTQAGLLPAIDGDGFYKVFVVTHTGDTRGQEWYTDLICTSLTAGPAAGTVRVADPAASGG